MIPLNLIDISIYHPTFQSYIIFIIILLINLKFKLILPKTYGPNSNLTAPKNNYIKFINRNYTLY